MSVGRASILQKTLRVIYDPAVRKSKLAFRLDYFPPIKWHAGVLPNLRGGHYEVSNQIHR